MSSFLAWLAANPDVVAEIVRAIGTIVGAVIIGVIGTLLAKRYQTRRDLQDRESQWRSHAVELTKLELQRKLQLLELERQRGTLSDQYDRPQPSMLDFLAHYRDLQELGAKTPKQLYDDIRTKRIRPAEDSGQLQAKLSSGSAIAQASSDAPRDTATSEEAIRPTGPD